MQSLGPVLDPVLHLRGLPNLRGQTKRPLVGHPLALIPGTPVGRLNALALQGLPQGYMEPWTYARTGNTWDYGPDGVMRQFGAGILPQGYDPVTREPLGALVEGAATNYLLNSDAPATQNVSLAAGAYCLWVVGSGSCALSGGPTGTAAEGSFVTFTLAGTTTVTFTVAGSLTRFQCEGGYTPSSFILTAGAAAARVRSNLILPLPQPGFSTDRGTFVCRAIYPIVPVSGFRALFDIGATSGDDVIRCYVYQDGDIRFRVLTGGVTRILYNCTAASIGAVAGKPIVIVPTWSGTSWEITVGGPSGVANGTGTSAFPTSNRLMLGQYVNSSSGMGNTHFLDAFFLPYPVSAQQRQLLAQVR